MSGDNCIVWISVLSHVVKAWNTDASNCKKKILTVILGKLVFTMMTILVVDSMMITMIKLFLLVILLLVLLLILLLLAVLLIILSLLL